MKVGEVGRKRKGKGKEEIGIKEDGLRMMRKNRKLRRKERMFGGNVLRNRKRKEEGRDNWRKRRGEKKKREEFGEGFMRNG